jgi:hypothetical protein
MARLSRNPDRDFCAGYGRRDLEIEQAMAGPPLPWDDILDDPAIRNRVGKLIADALHQHKSDSD